MSTPTPAIVPGRSTVYLVGELEPNELALFDAEEIRVRPRDAKGPRVEAIGHGIGYWRADVSVPRAFRSLSDGERLLRVALAVYAALGGTPFRLRATNWVEAQGVVNYATVLGFRSPRYGHVQAWPPNDPRNAAIRTAVEVAGRLIRRPWHRLAVRDLHAALLDPTPDAFLFAFRAVEDVRQSISPGTGRPAEWSAMHRKLGTTKAGLMPLTEVSTLVRHGTEGDPRVRAAQRPTRRRQILDAARDVVLRELQHLMGKQLSRLP